MRTVDVVTEHTGKNFSAYIEDAPIITAGNDIKEVEDNMRETIYLYLESCKDMNIVPEEKFLGEYELQFKIDIATLS